MLYTSLEPCPMPTVAIVSSRVGRVVVAAPDGQGGAVASERLATLPPAWSSLASQQGLVVDFASPESPRAPIPGELATRLRHTVWDTKDARDADVSQGCSCKKTSRPRSQTCCRDASSSTCLSREGRGSGSGGILLQLQYDLGVAVDSLVELPARLRRTVQR